MQVRYIKIGDFREITCNNSKIVQDKHIVSVKVDQEFLGALSNGDIADDLGSPLTPHTSPNSTFCVVFHIFIEGKPRDFKFGVQVDYNKCQPMDDQLSQRRRGHIV